MTVLRWHSHPLDSLRNSGDCIERHQWRVADLCRRICEACGICLRIELLLAALYHDEAERVIGDVPWSARQAYPELADACARVEKRVLAELGLAFDLTPDEWRVLRLADCADSWRWAVLHGDGANSAWGEFLGACRALARAVGTKAADWFDGFLTGTAAETVARGLPAPDITSPNTARS